MGQGAMASRAVPPALQPCGAALTSRRSCGTCPSRSWGSSRLQGANQVAQVQCHQSWSCNAYESCRIGPPAGAERPANPAKSLAERPSPFRGPTPCPAVPNTSPNPGPRPPPPPTRDVWHVVLRVLQHAAQLAQVPAPRHPRVKQADRRVGAVPAGRGGVEESQQGGRAEDMLL